MFLFQFHIFIPQLLILARCTGAVSVVSQEELCNLLGKSPEWFEPSPQLTQAHAGGFLGLEVGDICFISITTFYNKKYWEDDIFHLKCYAVVIGSFLVI